MRIVLRTLLTLGFLAGLLPPLTAAQAAAPNCDAAAEGTILYNLDHKIVQFCNGSEWIGLVAQIGGAGDTLADLSCASGEIAKWNGTVWACGADDAGALVDNLGNHTATANIQLGSNWLSGDGGNEGVYVDAAGNVGIGTTAPTSRLSVYGDLSVGNPATANGIALTGVAGSQRNLQFLSGAANRWIMQVSNTAESGSNAGSDFLIKRYDDAGAYLGSPIQISRSSGDTTIQGSLSVTRAGASNTMLVEDTPSDTSPFVIDSSGNVGIGTTVPNSKLYVAGSVKIADGGELCNAASHEGAMRYVAATDKFQMCRASATGWEDIGTGSGTSGITALTGDVTASGTGSAVATIAANAIGSAEITDASVALSDLAANSVNASKIVDASIALADLSATGAPSVSTYLRGDNTWAAISGADNLGNHIATTALRSDTNNTDDLGTTAIRWKDGWFAGTVTAGTFAGSGASLTALPAGNLTGTLPAISGANLTNLDAADLATGTIPAARMPALTGDVTMTAGTTTTALAADTVGLTELSATGTPSSTTYLRGDNTWAAVAMGDAPTLDGLDSAQFLRSDADDSTSGRIYATGGLAASQVMATATGSLGAFEARSQGSAGTAGAAFITFHRPSAYAAYFGIDTDNQLKFGGWSAGAVANKVWHAGNDGSGSGLDADLLDGQDSAYYHNASNLNAGTIAAARMPALTGDVTMTAGTTATNIAAGVVGVTELATDAVTNVKVAADAIGIAELSATGTPSSTTFLRGDNTWAVPAGGGGGATFQQFNSSGTWTKPGTGTIAFVECWGGGGAGGKHTSYGGGGGGGGGYNARWIPLASLGASVTVTVGAGGATVTTSATGGTGGTSSFGTFLYAYGGGGGSASMYGGPRGGGGGGQISAGSAHIPGEPKIAVAQGTDSYDAAVGLCFQGGPYYFDSSMSCGAFAGHFHGGPGGPTPLGSVHGGSGGGSYSAEAGAPSGGMGGAGGAGASAANGSAGSQPGGGGGGTRTGASSGAGGAGRCNVTVF